MHNVIDNHTIDILKKYFVFDKIFDLFDYDQNMEQLYDELKQLKRPVFESNYRFIFLQTDTEYYVNKTQPGFTLINLQRILAELDISNYFCIILTQQNLQKQSKLCNHMLTSDEVSIATFSVMLNPFFFERKYESDIKINTNKISKKFISLNRITRFHRRCLVALLKEKNMLDHGIVSYNHV